MTEDVGELLPRLLRSASEQPDDQFVRVISAHKHKMKKAADTIESLSAQLAAKDAEIERLKEAHDETCGMIVTWADREAINGHPTDKERLSVLRNMPTVTDWLAREPRQGKE